MSETETFSFTKDEMIVLRGLMKASSSFFDPRPDDISIYLIEQDLVKVPEEALKEMQTDDPDWTPEEWVDDQITSICKKIGVELEGA